MTEHEKMLRGLIYDPADPKLSKLSRYAKHKAYLLNQTDPSDDELYLQRLKDLFPGLGEYSYAAPGVQVDYGVNFKTGKNFFANYRFVVLDVCPVTCGDNVMWGSGFILSPQSTRFYLPSAIRAFKRRYGPRPGIREADRHQQRCLARFRRDSLRRRHHRGQHRHRGRGGRDQRHPLGRPGRRRPLPGHPALDGKRPPRGLRRLVEFP